MCVICGSSIERRPGSRGPLPLVCSDECRRKRDASRKRRDRASARDLAEAARLAAHAAALAELDRLVEERAREIAAAPLR